MTSPLVLPKTAKEAQEMLRAAGLPELTPPVIAEIVGMEGENFTQALATVAQGNVDREHPSLRYLLQIIAACVPATRAVLEPIQSESWAIGLRQQDKGLRMQVNKFLRVYREQGGFEKLGDQYLGEQKKDFQSRGIPFYF